MAQAARLGSEVVGQKEPRFLYISTNIAKRLALLALALLNTQCLNILFEAATK